MDTGTPLQHDLTLLDASPTALLGDAMREDREQQVDDFVAELRHQEREQEVDVVESLQQPSKLGSNSPVVRSTRRRSLAMLLGSMAAILGLALARPIFDATSGGADSNTVATTTGAPDLALRKDATSAEAGPPTPMPTGIPAGFEEDKDADHAEFVVGGGGVGGSGGAGSGGNGGAVTGGGGSAVGSIGATGGGILAPAEQRAGGAPSMPTSTPAGFEGDTGADSADFVIGG
eukprot:CAMPEP_0115479988 /NCGR_PEP_ID=MMETSP0271-20121206/57031_1 /TAXON_ID=71861 /ORGANISM="Scrippsiella trochoidea, Strain CCMP3099" /LENGTH=231 /DNA_ID=CAMNT_0002907639 /DNA_START=1 /DNA_END=692 /DNA_ORIENTATION=-